MHHLYSMCLFSVLSVGLTQIQAKAFSSSVECGKVYSGRKGRIVNGDAAQLTQFPWIASIKENGGHICGGTIISSRFILSASHCLNDLHAEGPIIDASRVSSWYKNYSVTLGANNLKDKEPQSTVFGIKTIIFHENYKRRGLLNDIMLLELDNEIQWTHHIQPICLPKSDIKESDKSVAAGWGKDEFNRTAENSKLRFVELTIFTNELCNKIYKERHLRNKLSEMQLCAGKINGEIRDTSGGDSGGPLLVNSHGREILVGITSSGTAESFPPFAPGIYVRTFKYLDWIHSHLQDSQTYFAALHNQ